MANGKFWTERPPSEKLGNELRIATEMSSPELRDHSSSGRAINGTKTNTAHDVANLGHGASSKDLDEVMFLRLPEVKALTGLSKSSLYAMIRESSFPAPVRLGTRAVAWVKSEVRQWAVDRVHASR